MGHIHVMKHPSLPYFAIVVVVVTEHQIYLLVYSFWCPLCWLGVGVLDFSDVESTQCLLEHITHLIVVLCMFVCGACCGSPQFTHVIPGAEIWAKIFIYHTLWRSLELSILVAVLKPTWMCTRDHIFVAAWVSRSAGSLLGIYGTHWGSNSKTHVWKTFFFLTIELSLDPLQSFWVSFYCNAIETFFV